ncbi:hypothetical protein PIB30_050712 [Stylosanthes scabra]|uniref:Uncharacterized protein n=1 Tax=Stylosanthes scabra TaxID=79078 RepID=A0ABU6VK07_9FABA|nr:hypothetical protein [Stylosanthes scabra]
MCVKPRVRERGMGLSVACCDGAGSSLESGEACCKSLWSRLSGGLSSFRCVSPGELEYCAQYRTPPAYYDFLSGPNPTTTQDETTPHEPSPSPLPQRPTRTVRPPPCGTGGHLHHGSGYM